ncbi:hypothetical protein [Porphyromonas sp. oral taxon 275]|uniref:hypothetical protein n=1 Tax=Porphyromonas sp. oral taxon 275 TaxID=712435 RepID=UPI001BAAA94C|nr:hypothetical protein [Porphyromonas sp. oral taxon 275]QUB43005.1 hypothetical protein J4862_08485 [Porphyromonas sp. oral taxon 275]
MNTQAMNHDPHSPIFIRGKVTPEKQAKAPAPPTRSIDWRRIIELALILALVVATVYFVSRLVTTQVVQIMSVIVGFLLLRFVVQTVLQVTFTILGFLFWLAIFVAILICIL